MVDQWTGFDTTVDTFDGVHPNDSGYRKMADRWYPALTAALGGTPTTTTTTTTTTTSPSSALSCTAGYTVTNQWAGGFQGEVRVAAGASAI